MNIETLLESLRRHSAKKLLQKNLRRKQVRKSRSRRTNFESLEPRVLLAVDYSVGAFHDLQLAYDSAVGNILIRDRSNPNTVLLTQHASPDEVVTVTGSNASDTLEIDASAASFTILFIGSAGNDMLVGPTGDNRWEIVALNQGKINDTISFEGVENLTGSSGKDEFLFGHDSNATGSLSGNIDAGAGSDTLDYSFYSTAISVDIGSSTATGTNSAAAFEAVVGSSSNTDTLIGPTTDARWTISDTNTGEIKDVVTFESIENVAV